MWGSCARTPTILTHRPPPPPTNSCPTGESLAQVLCLAGVRPIADSIGRVNKLELIPLEELGRPRIDVVVSCSGVFRDLFINQMNLLDRGVSSKALCSSLARASFALCRPVSRCVLSYCYQPFGWVLLS